MPSIVNGLFAGRSGLSSHGTAIAVVGDNISNSSTIGYKASRAGFEDLIAGGQTAGKVVGSGSTTSAVNTIFEQGTLEFTNRPLDLAIDGNGFFVVADGAERFYTRAGDFKINSSGYIVNQNDKAVLGFPAGGTGALEPLNVNTVSQDSVATNSVALAGNLDASEPSDASAIPTAVEAGDLPSSASAGAQALTYADLNARAAFSTVAQVFDSLGASHTITFFAFRTSASNSYTVRGYVNSEEVDTAGGVTGRPRLVVDNHSAVSPDGDITLGFNGDGTLSNATAAQQTVSIAWNNGADPSSIDLDFSSFTQYSGSSNILSIQQDGQGVGTVTSLNIESNGEIFARLSNGQSAIIGSIGMVNFSSPEGLTRVGGNLLQQSSQSGEPVVGKAQSGTFGSIESGRIELSTVDIANEFVKLITLQRGFQANSRIITTINQLLNDIIQLA
ncbi:MAG: flagellar hook protein FlgE [Deltaproteobacteria bacterium]|nr:flagellar hook protein FlgE [Deltaproteobacteria bacterium]